MAVSDRLIEDYLEEMVERYDKHVPENDSESSEELE